MIPNDSNTVVLECEPSVQNRVYVRRWTASDAASVITIVVVCVTAAVIMRSGPGAGLGMFTFEHIRLLGMVDTGSQRMGHRVGLILLGVLCAFGATSIARPAAYSRPITQSFRWIGKFVYRWCGVLIAASAALVIFFELPGTAFPEPGRQLQMEFLFLSIGLISLRLFWANRPRTRVLGAAMWIFLVSYSLFLMIPGLARVPDLFEPELSWTEWHYSATLAQGDRLAAGLRLGSQINLNYGLIHSLVLGVIERHWGFLNFGEHIRLVQASQVAFLIIAIFAFYLWKPKNPLFVLFGALLIGPWVSTSHVAIHYPNQSGWRSFGLAAGVLVLLMCRRQPLGRVAIILGAAAGFLLLYNPETGLCLSFGYGLFLLSRQTNLSPGQIGRLAVRAALGAVVVLSTTMFFYRAGLGTWPLVSAVLPFGFIQKFSQGYSGLRLYFDPLALLIFIHSIYVLSSSVLKWRVRNLELDESVKLAIAAAILTWAGYYANRPHAWNLWTFQFLYLFLAADFLEPGLFRHLSRRGLGAIFDVRLAALAFILIPMLFAMNHSIVLATLSAKESTGPSMEMISGISIPADVADELRGQAGYLASQDPGTLFFSRHSYSLSLLANRFNPLPVQDAFAETIATVEFENLVQKIEEISPRVILFDAPASRSRFAQVPTMNFFYTSFFDRLKNRLAGRYRQGPTTGGWQVWELRPPEVNAGITPQTSAR